MIRMLIVDDEDLGRERLRTLLADESDVEIVGESATAPDAIRRIAELKPDLVLLDVQLPEMDGFEVITQLDLDTTPAIIFVTAHDEYAVRAFDASAIDYLLKPVGADRLAAALNRVRDRRRTGQSNLMQTPTNLNVLLENMPGTGTYRERFAVRRGSRYTVVRAADVVAFVAADNYVKIHTGKEAFMMRGRISEVEKALDPRKFLRIHRSIIINLDHVVAIEPWGMGEHLFVLTNGEKLTSSRRYRHNIREAFGW